MLIFSRCLSDNIPPALSWTAGTPLTNQPPVFILECTEPVQTPASTGAFSLTASDLSLASYSVLVVSSARFNVSLSLVGSSAQAGTQVQVTALAGHIADLAGNVNAIAQTSGTEIYGQSNVLSPNL